MRTNAWASIWTFARLIAAAAMIAAIVAQFVSTVSDTIDDGRDLGTTIANFFSFFTILSNIVGAVALLAAVLWFWMRPAHETTEPRSLAVTLAAATSYLAITGIVYNTLLRGLTPNDDQVWWSNEILHVVAPAFLVLDLLVAPMRRALKWRAVLAILAFPILWIVYTLLRGPFVVNPNDGVAFWYPYPFLNPNGVNGWGGVTAYIIGIALAFVIVGTIVVWIGRLRARRSAASVG
jgi:hypothetical protein